MKYSLRFGIIAVCVVCVAFLFAQAIPSSTVHTYRYELLTRSQESKFANETSPAAGAVGKLYEVETDAQGRTTRVAVIRNGQRLSEVSYRFASGAKLPTGYEIFVGGEETGVVRIQRDEAGNRIREDYLTVNGTLTRYEIYFYSPDHVEDTHYTAEGKETRCDFLYYSANDILTRDVYYHGSPDPLNYVDVEFDPDTGLRKSRHGFKDGKLSETGSYTYDAADDPVRDDFYSGSHKWYSADEFKDGLRTRRIYQVWGATRELQYAYDEKRWLKESSLYYKENFVCRLVYDRLPDGTVKRTRALGPNGELWAEYPDMEISDVKINGEALTGESVIHKTGNWWNTSSTTPEGAAEVLTDTQGVDFGPYMKRVVEIVKHNWYTLMPPQVYPPILKQGKVSLEFSLLKDGKVNGMKVQTSSDEVALDRAAWESITVSSPFPPLPKEFIGQNVGLRFYYYYNLQPTEKLTDIIVLPGQEIRLVAGAKQKFSVTVLGATDSTVIWSVSGSGCAAAACGSISADGIYTAPVNVPSPATVAVIATLAADHAKTGSATVDIQANPSR